MAVADPSISFRISWLARLQRQRFDERARDLELTRAQWRVIAVVSVQPGVMQSGVAAKLEVSNVTAARIIDKLEEHGWVERRPDPADRRANRLYLTPSAAPVLERLTELGAQEDAVALTGITEDERRTLGRLLEAMIGNLTGPALQPAEADATGRRN